MLAPCDSFIETVYINPTENNVGTLGSGRASSIVFLTSDGTRICYGHGANVCVTQGDSVKAGDVVAKVGNNGMSWIPHIHVGAWKDNQPVQIRFDLDAMGAMLKELGINTFDKTA